MSLFHLQKASSVLQHGVTRMDTKNVIFSGKIERTEVPLILAVEDNCDNQLLLEYALAMFGWRYSIADNAMAAIALTKERQPDLILLDIVLPQISGLHIALMLKSHQQTQNIPLIAVTGLTKDRDKELIFAAGFNDYVSKPFVLEELQQAIARNLRPIPYFKEIFLF